MIEARTHLLNNLPRARKVRRSSAFVLRVEERRVTLEIRKELFEITAKSHRFHNIAHLTVNTVHVLHTEGVDLIRTDVRGRVLAQHIRVVSLALGQLPDPIVRGREALLFFARYNQVL